MRNIIRSITLEHMRILNWSRWAGTVKPKEKPVVDWREMAGYIRFPTVDMPVHTIEITVDNVTVSAGLIGNPEEVTFGGEFWWVDAGGLRIHSGELENTVTVARGDQFNIVFNIEIQAGHVFVPVPTKTVWVLKK